MKVIVTPFPGTRAEGCAKENQFTAILDAEGYVVGGRCDRAEQDGLRFLAVLHALSARYPFDPNDVVWPEGQQFDSDGRPLTVLEMDTLRSTYDLPNEELAA